MMLSDQQEREQASCPHQSFIVQAPAGSGKTEILTQRFLRLLAGVEAPEQIIALTFTRKAANEMRERILTALKNAKAGQTATSDHQKRTLEFAHQVLARDHALNWQLLSQPSRLRVMTIDALCQMITQAIPLQEKEIPFAAISDKPEQLYSKAAEHCVAHAMDEPNYQEALKKLLLHLDNQQARLNELLSTLLARREQWLHLIYEGITQDKSAYERALLLIEQHELKRLSDSIPFTITNALPTLASEIAAIENEPLSPRYPLTEWHDFHQMDARTAKALAALLLNAKGDSLRNNIDHHVGLRKDRCAEEVYTRLKAQGKQILQVLSEQPDFLEALSSVKNLPPPRYDAHQWDILNALFTILPLAAAHLKLVFAQAQEVDFSAVSEQALMALGDEESPSDLALYLDHSIQHLLIDEFQDTSITQFRLIQKLTAEWLPGDGKTLFVVGDPMQSIYRFRQAEVGLFLQSQQSGICQIPLTNLQLKCNFRSRPAIVNWVNQQFKAIFPSQADIESGAVPFSPASVVLDEDPEAQVEARCYASPQHEAASTASLIKELQARHEEESIAILVRSRSQLSEIIPCLRAEGIVFQGVDIDLLSELTHIKDLWTLTQCLLMPANRLAWLSLLRSPYIGLSLADLHSLAQIDSKASIFKLLCQNESWQDRLSPRGRARLLYLLQVMQKAFKQRGQAQLSDWVRSTHRDLHAEALYDDLQKTDIEQFWILLDKFEVDGQIEDFQAFETALEKLYSQQAVPSRLQIMTIHKSKGLEFDNVILPGLSAVIRSFDKPLLRWLKLPTKNSEALLLMSPLKAVAEENDPLYDYLSQLDKQKNQYEIQRLLYVAATRAKKRLFLLDYKEKPPANSLRNLLGNVVFQSLEAPSEAVAEVEKNRLYQLPDLYYQQAIRASEEITNHGAPSLSFSEASLSGVICHRLLQWVCDHQIKNPEDIPWHFAKSELQKKGIPPALQSSMLKEMKIWLDALFQSAEGQWIIARHSEEHNEYALLIEKNQQLQTRIIDRTFVDDNKLWIIDFKTGTDERNQQQKHRDQLNEYADIMRHHSPHSVHCGLYYLASQRWVSWQPEFLT